MSETQTTRSYDEEIKALEARLIEQDHRPFRVIWTFFETRKEPKSSRNRRAATVALVYNLFFSPTTLAAGGTIVGICTLVFLLWQTREMQAQTKIIQEANYATQLFEVIPRLYEPVGYGSDADRFKGKHSPADRRRAVEVYIDLRKTYKKPIDLSGALLDGKVRLSNLELENADFSRAQLDGCVFHNCNLQGANFRNADLYGADFSQAKNLEKASFHGAVLTNVTWPSGFTPPNQDAGQGEEAE